MVAWNRDVGFTYKPQKANVAPIVPGQDDRRSAYIRNQAIQNANEVRQRRATVENPDWAMSRPAEWYQNRENLASVKDTLTQLKGNQDFWTTNQDESRNMYQMVMNNMVGGGGARMLDLRGLPSVVQRNPNKYRRGRTLFQDPSKSAGFLNDLKVMLGDLTFQDKRWPEEERTSNPAAVRATEYNPFHEEGYGRDFYIDEFGQPLGEKLKGIMKMALPGPLKFLQGKEREPLTPDRSWIPEGLGEYDEVPMIDFDNQPIIEDEMTEDEMTEDIPLESAISYEDPDLVNNLLYGEPDIVNDAVGDGYDITEEEPFELQEAKFPIGNIGTDEYSPNMDLNIMNIQDPELRQAAMNAAIRLTQVHKEGEGGDYYGELEELYQDYLDAVEAGAQ